MCRSKTCQTLAPTVSLTQVQIQMVIPLYPPNVKKNTGRKNYFYYHLEQYEKVSLMKFPERVHTRVAIKRYRVLSVYGNARSPFTETFTKIKIKISRKVIGKSNKTMAINHCGNI